MNNILLIAQVVIALGIFNVWLLRRRKASPWRGGDAQTMREEFLAYGLSSQFMKIIYALKVGLAVVLLLGIWIPVLTKPAAAGIALLMLGAVIMHAKIKDPLSKSLPATSMLVMASAVALI